MSKSTFQVSVQFSDVFLVLAVLAALVVCWFQPFDNANGMKSHVERTVDSVSVSSAIATTRNAQLIQVLQERVAVSRNLLATRESSLVQIRICCLSVLAVLLALLMRDGNLMPGKVRLLPLALVLALYLLDVHLEDQLSRQRYVESVYEQAVDSFVASMPTDTSWRTLEYRSFQAELNDLSATHNRLPRKLTRLVQPNAPQTIFYIFPAVVLYFLARASLRRK